MVKFLFFMTISTLALFGSLVPDELLKQLDLPVNLSDNEVFEIAQTQWRQNKERWDFEPKLEEKKEELKPIFASMGYLDEQKPKQSHYDYALLIGASYWSVKTRVTYLEKFIEQGGDVQQIIFLTGMRPLRDVEKNEVGGLTEIDMIRSLYERSGISRSIPVLFIQAPMLGDKRPGTVETISYWLQSNPKPGHCLVITTQPFIPFHEALLDNVLPASFTRDFAAGKASDAWTVALLLDTIAKRLDFIRGSVYTKGPKSN